MADDETEENVYKVHLKPSFVLIAIDTHPAMFIKSKKENDVESSPFQDCLRACHEVTDALVLNKVKNSWSPFAVVLAANETTTLVDFKDNILDSIKVLDEKKSLTNEKLGDDYCRKGPVDLGMFFLACKKKFKQISNDFYKRTMIYITNDDEPTGGDKDQKFTALNEVRNFAGDQIDFEMVTMKAAFDYSLFYNELFSLLKTQTCENLIEDSDGLVDKLTREICMKFTQHKLVFYPFKNDLKRFLKCTRKKATKKATLYNNAHVSSDGVPVKKVVKNPDGAAKTFRVKTRDGGIPFDLDDYNDVMQSDLPNGLTLLHTSKRLSDPAETVNHPDLLEVNAKEELADYFYQFWQYCVDRNKVLICARKSRKLDKIRFVELIPMYVNDAKVFLVKKIPWIDELRPPPRMPKPADRDVIVEEEAKKKIVNDILDKLTYDYDPKMFASPPYVRKKNFLKSKLLGIREETFEDPTLDTNGIDVTLANVGEKFKDLFNLNREAAGKKRKAPSKAGGGSRKKTK